MIPRIRAGTATLIVLVIASLATALPCEGCHGRGQLVFNGSNYCRCDCVRQVSANGSYAQYVGPTCRFSTTQREILLMATRVDMAAFRFSDFTDALVLNLQQPPTLTEYKLDYVRALAGGGSQVLFELRSEAEGRNSFLRARYDTELLLQAFQSSAAWLAPFNISLMKRRTQDVAPAFSIPSAGSVQGYALPIESVLVVSAAFLIVFFLWSSEIAFSDNMITDVTDVDKLMADWRLARMGKRAEAYTEATSAAAPRVSAPKVQNNSWLDGDDDDTIETDEPTPKLERKGTTSINDYRAKFYANA